MVDPGTGQVTHSQPFNAPASDFYYDSIGRLYRTEPAGGRTIWNIVSSCTATANCAVKRQVFEAGAPVKTEYLDLLGRTIGAGVEGFDGYENLSRSDFNQRGAKFKEYVPYHTMSVQLDAPGEPSANGLFPWEPWHVQRDLAAVRRRELAGSDGF